MEHSYFHKLSTILWAGLVGLITVLAIYVSFGRLLMSQVEHYEVQILQQLNLRLPFTLEADSVVGQWHFFSPELVLGKLKVTIEGSTEPPIELKEGRMTLDVLASLQSRNLQVSKLLLDALSLKGELSEDGKFSLSGMGKSRGQLGNWLEQFLLNIETVELTNNKLSLSLPNDQERLLQLDLGLQRDGNKRTLSAKIFSQTTGTIISAVAEGVGNPVRRDAFVGELYLDIDMSDLKAFTNLIDLRSAVDIEGALQAEVWLGWDRGASSISLTMQGRDLKFFGEDRAWQLPAELISLQANLVQRNDHWTAFISDFKFYKDDIDLHLSRLQMDRWGDSLRLRAESVPLAPLNDLLVDLSLTPDAVADVFDVLQARGKLSALQIDVADMRTPLDSWKFLANFQELEVDSWRGAPGVSSAKGYVELAEDGGFVALDSQSFALDFKTVYKEPLYYDDFFGNINVNWDETALTLSSGLLSLRDIEGTAHVLFGLNIPLLESDVGLEMDLLVGLQNFAPEYRSKYLPFILSDSLLGWLKPSIGEGRIEQGAFIWRGSLTSKTENLKTIQLFFNVADTELNYHPDWPPVSGVDGIVLIDDTNVSVWSENAKLYNSDIKALSAETWMDDHDGMVLAVSGLLQGDAGDALRVVNNSPLTEMVGSVFERWGAAGALRTELELQILLNGADQTPQIDVKTQWQGVDLQVEPGNLAVSNIDGVFSYNSEIGFSSYGLEGRLWDKALTAEVIQGDVPSALEVALSATIDMTDVQQWLELDFLALAKGEARTDVGIHITPDKGAVLSVESELLGVELDLPRPWGKASQQEAHLQLAYPLTGGASLLEINLQSGLQLHLQLDQNQFIGAALSFYDAPGEVAPGVLRISGHTPLIDADEWQSFIERYVKDDFLTELDEQNGLAVTVDTLGADTLILMGQDVRDVVLSLEKNQGQWAIDAETSWLAGDLRLAPGDEVSALTIRSLDLAALDKLVMPDAAGNEPLQLPDILVSIAGLHNGELPLGEIDFMLQTQGSTLHASQIVGSIAGLEIAADNPAKLSWLQGAGIGHTSLQAQLLFTDFGTTLEQLGYQRIIETKSGNFDVALEWPGGPQSVSLEHARGSLLLNVGAGTFLNAPEGASGALRVLSILNLAEVIGRLSLSHMFSSGISFHSLEGEVFLQDGGIEVANIEVDGSTGGFQFSGVADVQSETLEGNLVVTLPVASNLPWIVALTAGLPVAAGVYVVSKVFEKQVNRLTSGVYGVSGPWDDPQVNFVQIFDDSSTGVSAVGGRGAGIVGQLLDPNAPLVLPVLVPADPNGANGVVDPNTATAIETEAIDPNTAGV